jgi:hypothetical protein
MLRAAARRNKSQLKRTESHAYFDAAPRFGLVVPRL